jgi:hypothetical protein
MRCSFLAIKIEDQIRHWVFDCVDPSIEEQCYRSVTGGGGAIKHRPLGFSAAALRRHPKGSEKLPSSYSFNGALIFTSNLLA